MQVCGFTEPTSCTQQRHILSCKHPHNRCLLSSPQSWPSDHRRSLANLWAHRAPFPTDPLKLLQTVGDLCAAPLSPAGPSSGPWISLTKNAGMPMPLFGSTITARDPCCARPKAFLFAVPPVWGKLILMSGLLLIENAVVWGWSGRGRSGRPEVQSQKAKGFLLKYGAFWRKQPGALRRPRALIMGKFLVLCLTFLCSQTASWQKILLCNFLTEIKGKSKNSDAWINEAKLYLDFLLQMFTVQPDYANAFNLQKRFQSLNSGQWMFRVCSHT